MEGRACRGWNRRAGKAERKSERAEVRHPKREKRIYKPTQQTGVDMTEGKKKLKVCCETLFCLREACG